MGATCAGQVGECSLSGQERLKHFPPQPSNLDKGSLSRKTYQVSNFPNKSMRCWHFFIFCFVPFDFFLGASYSLLTKSTHTHISICAEIQGCWIYLLLLLLFSEPRYELYTIEFLYILTVDITIQWKEHLPEARWFSTIKKSYGMALSFYCLVFSGLLFLQPYSSHN